MKLLFMLEMFLYMFRTWYKHYEVTQENKHQDRAFKFFYTVMKNIKCRYIYMCMYVCGH